MIKPKKHVREIERLEALRNTEILDTGAEQEYDDITFLASYITKSPVSMISLVDAERQWFKSKVGLDFNETPRDEAFCAHAIHETEIFEVQNAEADERFHDNPLVTQHKLKFYAGTQIFDDNGLPLGTLCVMDNKPKKLDKKERAALNALGRQVHSLFKLREKNEEVAKELSIAKNIQRSMLPGIFESNSFNKNIELAASMNCAKEVGGDLYDYFYIDDKHLAFVLGDVSGKGVPAALYMSMSKMLIRATANTNSCPCDCIIKVNDLLACENTSSMFITLFYGIINVETGEVEYVNGGHNPPLIVRKNGDVVELKDKSQLTVGILEDYKYCSNKITLEDGDYIVAYTDGITEAFNKEDNQYGEKRLQKIVKENHKKSLKELNELIVFDVFKHSEGTIQSDDITMLLLKYNSK